MILSESTAGKDAKRWQASASEIISGDLRKAIQSCNDVLGKSKAIEFSDKEPREFAIKECLSFHQAIDNDVNQIKQWLNGQDDPVLHLLHVVALKEAKDSLQKVRESHESGDFRVIVEQAQLLAGISWFLFFS